MRRTWAAVVVCAVLIVSASSCVVHADRSIRGSGRVTEEVHKLRSFSAVDFGTVGDLHIRKGSRCELRIEAEENLHDYIELDVSGGTLKIKTRRGVNLRPKRDIEFYLTVKELDEIVLSGAGDIDAPDLEGRHVRLAISGAGNIETEDLDAKSVELEISGAGNILIAEGKSDDVEIYISGSGNIEMDGLRGNRLDLKISGSGSTMIKNGGIDEQRIVISGSGDYKATRLKCERARVRISGSGDASIYVEEKLEARISGSGDIHYRGRPSIRGSVSGSGNLDRI